MAPPCGLSLSLKGSTPMPRAEGITWAAKASFDLDDVDIVDRHLRSLEGLLRRFDPGPGP